MSGFAVAALALLLLQFGSQRCLGQGSDEDGDRGGPDQSCPLCATTSDATCGATDCLGGGNCSTVEFTAPCNGTYTIRAWTVCTPTDDCSDCSSCVNVFKTSDGSRVGGCHTTGCDLGNCSFTCSITLGAGTSYKLSVCKTNCPNSSCEECGIGCTAYGSVYREVAACP